MTLQSKSGIYICTCLPNGKVYIGQSKDVKNRKCRHLSKLRYNHHYNSHLQKAYNKYGEENFEWGVLEYCNVDMLDEREMYWIEQYDSFENGFNQNEGGGSNRNYKRSESFKKHLSSTIKDTWKNDEDRREKLSESMKGKNNPMYGRYGKLNPAYGKDHSGKKNGMYGKRHKEESNELNRMAHLGANNVCSRAVVCVETGQIFGSMGEAGRVMGCNDTSINKCCRGKIKSAGGYHWRYATEEEK